MDPRSRDHRAIGTRRPQGSGLVVLHRAAAPRLPDPDRLHDGQDPPGAEHPESAGRNRRCPEGQHGRRREVGFRQPASDRPVGRPDQGDREQQPGFHGKRCRQPGGRRQRRMVENRRSGTVVSVESGRHPDPALCDRTCAPGILRQPGPGLAAGGIGQTGLQDAGLRQNARCAGDRPG